MYITQIARTSPWNWELGDWEQLWYDCLTGVKVNQRRQYKTASLMWHSNMAVIFAVIFAVIAYALWFTIAHNCIWNTSIAIVVSSYWNCPWHSANRTIGNFNRCRSTISSPPKWIRFQWIFLEVFQHLVWCWKLCTYHLGHKWLCISRWLNPLLFIRPLLILFPINRTTSQSSNYHLGVDFGPRGFRPSTPVQVINFYTDSWFTYCPKCLTLPYRSDSLSGLDHLWGRVWN